LPFALQSLQFCLGVEQTSFARKKAHSFRAGIVLTWPPNRREAVPYPFFLPFSSFGSSSSGFGGRHYSAVFSTSIRKRLACGSRA
jgi:hypothetical protein